MSAVAERGLFAAKGRAAPGPVELPRPSASLATERRDADAPATGRDLDDPVQQPHLPLAVPGADEPGGARGGHPPRAEAPPGSLLDFRLRGGTARAALTDDIRAALKGRPETGPGDAARTAETDTIAQPAPSSRIDRPLFPQGARTEPAGASAAPAVPPIAAPIVPPILPPAPSVWRTIVPALAAIIGIAVVGWLVANGGTPASPPSTDTVAAAALVTAAGSAEASGAERVAGAPAPISADLEPAPPSASPAPKPETGPAAGAVEMPSFDIVRVTPDAPPVVAGRAAPGSELIVLDNGVPLGTVVADVNGEWALVSDEPLAPGRHELSLAITTSEGTVVIEQADTAPVPPETAPLDPAALPTPGEKPAAGAAGVAPGYVVQLASVPATADAELEWARLQSAYPSLLAGRDAEIAAAEIGGRGTFYRVRTGPFDGRDAARALCHALNTAGQECLVVRQATP